LHLRNTIVIPLIKLNLCIIGVCLMKIIKCLEWIEPTCFLMSDFLACFQPCAYSFLLYFLKSCSLFFYCLKFMGSGCMVSVCFDFILQNRFYRTYSIQFLYSVE
jgi:hypothetical protein